MRQINIPGTSLRVSRFIFGTASLFKAGPQSVRRNLLSAAYEHGFTHFDTAPYYGFGWAERDLAPLLAVQPSATVSTKVGLYSPGGERQPQLAVAARKTCGQLFRPISRPVVDWSLARAERSLAGSLQRLGRARVDFYLLHEPDLALINTEEWLLWLEQEVKRGRVGRFGLALHGSRLRPFLQSGTPLAGLVQTADSVEGREADCLTAAGRPLQITYGYVSAAPKGTVDVPALLATALDRNRDGAIIVSSRRIERLGQYALAVERHDRPHGIADRT